MERPAVLVCAGRDSSGRAGIDADLQALAALGVDSLPVVTSETVQEGRRVLAIEPRPEAEWTAEVRQVGVRAAAWKSGLLSRAEAVAAFAALVGELAGSRPVVCDPVLAATGGERFLDEEGVAALRGVLLPRGVVVTPNLPEAAELTGLDPPELVHDFQGRIEAAERLLALGARAVLLKGGHGGEDPVRDLVLERGKPPVWLAHPRVAGGIRGSGCRYASAVAAGLARGEPLDRAAAAAGEKVLSWILQGVPEGRGSR